jgi:hypothetical protein
LLLAALGVLAAGAVALGVAQSQSAAALRPVDLQSQLLSASDLGTGWRTAAPDRVGSTNDTWNGSACSDNSTSFGGPIAVRVYAKPGAMPVQFEELVTQPQADPAGILAMLQRCAHLRSGAEQFTTVLDGLGDHRTAVLVHFPNAPQAHELFGTMVQGSDFVRIVYEGTDPLPQFRTWAQEALAKLEG